MMKKRAWWMLALMPMMLSLMVGCPAAPPAGTLDNIDDLDDGDGDGFGELPNCTDDPSTETIMISVDNEITREDAEALAVEMFGIDLPEAILATVGIRLDFRITRVYAGGECMDEGSRELNPFSFMVEAVCPDTVRAEVDVIATIPFVGEQVVFQQEFTTSQDDSALGFACGRVISLRAFLDPDTGAPDADIEITDQ